MLDSERMPQPTFHDETPKTARTEALSGSSQEIYQTQPPLSDAEIDEMNKRRYPKFLSSEEIESINKARARGIHHGV